MKLLIGAYFIQDDLDRTENIYIHPEKLVHHIVDVVPDRGI
jgi:hypothetical protein